MFLRLLFIVRESFSSVKYPLLFMVATGFFLFATIGLMKNLYTHSRSFFGIDRYTVYFEDDASNTEIRRYVATVNAHSDVKSVLYIPGSDVKKNVAKSFPEIAVELNTLNMNNFPSYADVTLKPISREKMDALLKELEHYGVVNQVIGYRKYTLQVERLLNYIRYAGHGITVILLCAFFVCALMIIQQNIYRNFDEIKVLKMLGAGNGYTLKPHLIYIFVLGNVVFFVSLSLSVASLSAVGAYLSQTDFLSELKRAVRFLEPVKTIQLYAGMIIFSMLGAYVAGRQAIKQITNIIL